MTKIISDVRSSPLKLERSRIYNKVGQHPNKWEPQKSDK